MLPILQQQREAACAKRRRQKYGMQTGRGSSAGTGGEGCPCIPWLGTGKKPCWGVPHPASEPRTTGDSPEESSRRWEGRGEVAGEVTLLRAPSTVLSPAEDGAIPRGQRPPPETNLPAPGAVMRLWPRTLPSTDGHTELWGLAQSPSSSRCSPRASPQQLSAATAPATEAKEPRSIGGAFQTQIPQTSASCFPSIPCRPRSAQQPAEQGPALLRLLSHSPGTRDLSAPYFPSIPSRLPSPSCAPCCGSSPIAPCPAAGVRALSHAPRGFIQACPQNRALPGQSTSRQAPTSRRSTSTTGTGTCVQGAPFK